MHHKMMLILCVCIIIAAFLLDVDDGRLSVFGLHLPSTCALRNIFGVKCAFCGMTRSVVATAHGQFKSAFQLHPFGPPLFLFILLQIPYRIYSVAISPKEINRILVRASAVVFAALLAGIMANWLVYLGGMIL